MFKVECPGCKASYNVDERRVPDTGLKMRCPKCSTTFLVKRPGADDAGSDLPLVAGAARASSPDLPSPAADLPAVRADLPAAKGAPPRPPLAAKKPPSPPAAPPRQTQLGLGDRTSTKPVEEDMLPAIRPAARPAQDSAMELDLPSPFGPRARPAAAAANAAPEIEIDLPTRQGPAIPPRPTRPNPMAPPRAALPSGDELDLPSPHAAGLPAPRGAPVATAKSPRQVTGGALFDDLDVAPPGGLDLPLPRAGADLPSPRRGSDLPAVAAGASAKRGSDLPIAKPGADLPASRDLGRFGEIDLPLPTAQRGPPPGLASAADFLPVAAANAGLPAAKGAADPFDFNPGTPADFEAPLSFASEPPPPSLAATSAPDTFASAPPPPPPAAAIQRQAGGGTAFGEVDLGAGDTDAGAGFGTVPPPRGPSQAPPGSTSPPGWGERDLGGGGGGDDDMEFGAIPQEGVEGGPPPTSASQSLMPSRVVAAPRSRSVQAETPQVPKRRALKVTAGVLGALIVVGAATGLLTPYGYFGGYLMYDAYKAKDWDALLATTKKSARDSFTKDTADAAAEGLRTIDAAYTGNERARSLASYGAFSAYLRELRFGHDAAVHARGKGMLATVPVDVGGSPHDLARAAQMAATDQLARGANMTEAVLRRTPNDPDALALMGEIALAQRDADRALTAFGALGQVEPSPRSLFGLARAQLLKGQRAEALATAKKVADLSATHAGARLVLARLTWDTTRDEASTLAYLDKVLKDPAVHSAASTRDLVGAHTLVGEISLRRSRVSAAEAAFNEALKLDPKASAALAGVGEALYRAGRHAEALARFGSAMESDPEAIEPKIGVAKTKIALERLSEAKDLLKGLAKSLKDQQKPSFAVISWLGRAEEALGDKVAAEADYVDAIKLAGVNTEIVDTYVALAQLLIGQGRPAEAEARLAEAKAKLPRSVALHKALGDIAMQAGRYDEAERDYAAALAMDDSDISTRFKMGIVLRRLGKFEAAGAAFDKVAAADKEYPSLSLERAVLFEASGQFPKALEMYRAALAKAPGDPDLMLRVAAAQVASGQVSQAAEAEELLRKVIAARQNSAEANHFLGRALLLRGTNLAEALKYLTRATDLDQNRAEYWLYVGWAANEADQQAKAQSALERTLDLDKSMADAYWQRGVLRRRQRAVIDAEVDLNKALELRPSRYEAYATLAEVYEDQQKWPQALAAWQKAIAANGNRPEWRYRLGKLMAQQGNRVGALEHLAKAMEIINAADAAKPAWLAELAEMLANAQFAAGKRAEALQNFQLYLSLAQSDAPYLENACKHVAQLGGTSPACKHLARCFSSIRGRCLRWLLAGYWSSPQSAALASTPSRRKPLALRRCVTQRERGRVNSRGFAARRERGRVNSRGFAARRLRGVYGRARDGRDRSRSGLARGLFVEVGFGGARRVPVVRQRPPKAEIGEKYRAKQR